MKFFKGILEEFHFGNRGIFGRYPLPPWSNGMLQLGPKCILISCFQQLTGKILEIKDLARPFLTCQLFG
jgi:hypothetical protein